MKVAGGANLFMLAEQRFSSGPPLHSNSCFKSETNLGRFTAIQRRRFAYRVPLDLLHLG